MNIKKKLGYPKIFFNKLKFTFFFHIERWDAEIKDEEYNEWRIYILFWELNLIYKK